MANKVQNLINGWFNRLLGAASDGSFSGHEMYAANRTSRDYLWNSIGLGIWGFVFPLLTVVVTQRVGVEQAGMFSLAFVVGLLLTFVANYGVRTYQVSDTQEVHSFSDYQIHRCITCAVMLVAGVLYCVIRGYEPEMFIISMGVYFYKMIDGLADVYEGRLQQMGKLYLAGISQTVRSVLVLVSFSICLLIGGNLAVSSVVMAVAALVSFLILTLPLALLETPKSQRHSLVGITTLFRHCSPLFLALFMFSLIDSMPKFVMEGVLTYDNQLYFNALYFPAQAILMIIQLVYKPQLVRITNLWADQQNRRKFDLMVLAIVAVIMALTLLMILAMGWFGLSVLSFLYGVDFEQFRGLCYIMLVAGGVVACIDFLYQVITVLRQQKSVIAPYFITFFFSMFIPILMVNFTGLPGIVIGYLIVMSLLLVLLVWEYFRIRRTMSLKNAALDREEQRLNRRSEIIAEREKRTRMQLRKEKMRKKRNLEK